MHGPGKERGHEQQRVTAENTKLNILGNCNFPGWDGSVYMK